MVSTKPVGVHVTARRLPSLTPRRRPRTTFDATALIHQTSRGYPRAINNLAVQALLAAYTDGKAIVDESSTRTAVTEVTTE